MLSPKLTRMMASSNSASNARASSSNQDQKKNKKKRQSERRSNFLQASNRKSNSQEIEVIDTTDGERGRSKLLNNLGISTHAHRGSVLSQNREGSPSFVRSQFSVLGRSNSRLATEPDEDLRRSFQPIASQSCRLSELKPQYKVSQFGGGGPKTPTLTTLAESPPDDTRSHLLANCKQLSGFTTNQVGKTCNFQIR